jgi:hypothetical protein
MEPRLLRRFLSILKRDLDQSIGLLGLGEGQDFWFWRAFLGAYSVAKHQAQSYDPTLNSLQQAFGGFVKSWKRATGLALWEEVHNRLSTVAWPTSQAQELGPNVWRSATEFETSQ